MKTPAEMTFTELVDYYTGYACLEIGRGQALRGAIALMLQNIMRDSYERGKADATVGKKQ